MGMSDTGNDVISERLATLRREQGLTLRECAEKLKLNQSRYSNWEFGIRTPKHNELIRAAEMFGVSPAWLAGFSDHRGNTIGEDNTYVTAPMATVATKTRGAVKITNASSNTAFHVDYLVRRKLAENRLLLVTSDDESMAPTIRPGDEVLIDQKRTKVTTIDLFALLVQDRVWVRWIRPELDGTYTVTADNSERYPPQHLNADQFADLDILGRVARISHDR